MAYDINADSYPDYDEWGSDDYWKIPEWQKFYDELLKKYGADEGSRRWLDAWWRQGFGANPINNRLSIADWSIARGLWNNSKKDFYKAGEFIPPSIQNQGQVTTTIDPKTGLSNSNTIGVQPTEEELKNKTEQSDKKIKGWIIGGSVLIVGLTIVYFILRAKNKQ
jgi:hypothetical protein